MQWFWIQLDAGDITREPYRGLLYYQGPSFTTKLLDRYACVFYFVKRTELLGKACWLPKLCFEWILTPRQCFLHSFIYFHIILLNIALTC